MLVVGAAVTTQQPLAQPQDKPVRAVEVSASKEPPPDENALIEAALVEQGYFREDVPLTYQEQDFLQSACEEFGVEYPLMLALIERETRFQNVAGDGGDSMGYCQIQKRWWGWLMEEIGAEDLTDPQDNFRTGCAIIAELTTKYDGAVDKALVAYNSGHYAGEITRYASAVLEAAEVWKTAIENPPAEADG